MSRPAHDWALLDYVDEDAEEQLILEAWWLQEDQDQEFINQQTRDSYGHDEVRHK